jgi:hypothetical protein
VAKTATAASCKKTQNLVRTSDCCIPSSVRVVINFQNQCFHTNLQIMLNHTKIRPALLPTLLIAPEVLLNQGKSLIVQCLKMLL